MLHDSLGLRDGAYAENPLGFKVPVMRLLGLDGRYPESQMVFERQTLIALQNLSDFDDILTETLQKLWKDLYIVAGLG